MDILAVGLLFLGTLFLVSAVLGGLFPGMFRKRSTGELPDRKRFVIRNISLACICYLAVMMLTYQVQ